MTRRAYCSWCLHKTAHRLERDRLVARDDYRCSRCGLRTVKCRWCDEMARGRTDDLSSDAWLRQIRKLWTDELCAVHDGSIASFETAGTQLDDLADYALLFRRDKRNLRQLATIAGLSVAGAAVLAPAAWIGAPAFAAWLGAGGWLGAAGTGTAIVELSGAALTNASLAALGGGLGMAGGTLVVTAAGAALGAHQGAIVSNAYLGQIEDFRITKLQDGRGPAVVVIDGFLTQRRSTGADWRAGLKASHPNSPWYHVAWESRRLHEIGTALASNGAATLFGKGLALAKRGTQKTPRFLPAVVLASLLARNPWHTALVRASMTGVLLADLLARTRQPSGFTLIGHSLGARVIYYALAALQTKQRRIVRDAHLLGGAVGCGDAKEWHAVTSAVSGHVFNYFSENDAVLKYAYRAGSGLTSIPIGIRPIGAACEQVLDIDVSGLVSEHTAYKRRLSEIFSRATVRRSKVTSPDTCPSSGGSR